MSAANSPSPYETLYFQGDPGDGIGTYNLKDVLDTLFPFDYDGDGKQDLFLYRPGGKEAFVLHSRGDGNFDAVCPHGMGDNGIGGFNLADALDRVVPIHFTSTLMLLTICCYTGLGVGPFLSWSQKATVILNQNMP
jgi:1-phosphatidylinositol phosphodiesterase